MPDMPEAGSGRSAGPCGRMRTARGSRAVVTGPAPGRLGGWKRDFVQSDSVDHAFPAVVIADFKPALATFLVPPDAVQPFVDGRHGRDNGDVPPAFPVSRSDPATLNYAASDFLPAALAFFHLALAAAAILARAAALTFLRAALAGLATFFAHRAR